MLAARIPVPAPSASPCRSCSLLYFKTFAHPLSPHPISLKGSRAKISWQTPAPSLCAAPKHCSLEMVSRAILWVQVSPLSLRFSCMEMPQVEVWVAWSWCKLAWLKPQEKLSYLQLLGGFPSSTKPYRDEDKPLGDNPVFPSLCGSVGPARGKSCCQGQTLPWERDCAGRDLPVTPSTQHWLTGEGSSHQGGLWGPGGPEPPAETFSHGGFVGTWWHGLRGWFTALFMLVCLLFPRWRMSNGDCVFLPTTWKGENRGNRSKDVLPDEFWLIHFRGWWRQRFSTSKYTLAALRLFLHAFHNQNSRLFSLKCGTLPTSGIKHPHVGDPDEICPLGAKPGESILPSPQPCSSEGAAPARFGIPVGSGCFSCSHLWGVEDVLALRKNSEVEKKIPNPQIKQKKKMPGGLFSAVTCGSIRIRQAGIIFVGREGPMWAQDAPGYFCSVQVSL